MSVRTFAIPFLFRIRIQIQGQKGHRIRIPNQCCGSGIRIRIPDPDFYPSRIPDLGSRIPDPGSGIPDPKTATKERGEK